MLNSSKLPSDYWEYHIPLWRLNKLINVMADKVHDKNVLRRFFSYDGLFESQRLQATDSFNHLNLNQEHRGSFKGLGVIDRTLIKEGLKAN